MNYQLSIINYQLLPTFLNFVKKCRIYGFK
jgi:hypothetical protein